METIQKLFEELTVEEKMKFMELNESIFNKYKNLKQKEYRKKYYQNKRETDVEFNKKNKIAVREAAAKRRSKYTAEDKKKIAEDQKLRRAIDRGGKTA